MAREGAAACDDRVAGDRQEEAGQGAGRAACGGGGGDPSRVGRTARHGLLLGVARGVALAHDGSASRAPCAARALLARAPALGADRCGCAGRRDDADASRLYARAAPLDRSRRGGTSCRGYARRVPRRAPPLGGSRCGCAGRAGDALQAIPLGRRMPRRWRRAERVVAVGGRRLPLPTRRRLCRVQGAAARARAAASARAHRLAA
eukprot:7115428-Prymnesium_polylepis.1